MRTTDEPDVPVGSELPEGTRFVGPEPGPLHGWLPGG